MKEMAVSPTTVQKLSAVTQFVRSVSFAKSKAIAGGGRGRVAMSTRALRS